MSVTAANLLGRLNGALDNVSDIGHIGQKAGLWDVNLPHTAEEGFREGGRPTGDHERGS